MRWFSVTLFWIAKFSCVSGREKSCGNRRSKSQAHALKFSCPAFCRRPLTTPAPSAPRSCGAPNSFRVWYNGDGRHRARKAPRLRGTVASHKENSFSCWPPLACLLGKSGLHTATVIIQRQSLLLVAKIVIELKSAGCACQKSIKALRAQSRPLLHAHLRSLQVPAGQWSGFFGGKAGPLSEFSYRYEISAADNQPSNPPT